MSSSILSLTTGQNIKCTAQGLRIEGEMNYEQWTELLRTIHSVKSAFHCVLADHLLYGRNRFGDAPVAIALEQAEFDLADVTKADAISQLTLDFRETKQLSSEHYFVLSKLDTNEERARWADATTKHQLSPLELKRSIQAGKVLRTSDIQNTSGQGTGINTIQGAIFKIQQWERDMGGVEKIILLPEAERRNLLNLLIPTLTLVSAIENSLGIDQ